MRPGNRSTLKCGLESTGYRLLKNFRFFLLLAVTVFGERLLKHTDNLCKTLQNPSLTASEGQQITQLTIDKLQQIRTTEASDLFGKIYYYYKRNLIQSLRIIVYKKILFFLRPIINHELGFLIKGFCRTQLLLSFAEMK